MARDGDENQAYLKTESNHYISSSTLHAFQSSTCTNTFREDSSKTELSTRDGNLRSHAPSPFKATCVHAQH